MVEIRTAAEQLAAEQQERATSAAGIDELVGGLEQMLELHGIARHNGNGHNGRRSA
jgi:hypothetical protein